MAEISQIKFSLQELTEILVKQQGLSEGHWQLMVEFGFGASNAGPNEKDVKPTALIAVQALGLSRAPGPGPLTIDASKLVDATKT